MKRSRGERPENSPRSYREVSYFGAKLAALNGRNPAAEEVIGDL
jgi:hypothetical protein